MVAYSQLGCLETAPLLFSDKNPDAYPRNPLAFFTAFSLGLLFEQTLSLLRFRYVILVWLLLFHGVPGVEDDGVGDDGDGGRRVPVDRDREEDVAVKGKGGL